MADLLVVQYGA